MSSALRIDAGADVLPFDITEHTLDNGLRVLVVPTGFPNLVSLQIPVQTGSRNEIEPGKSGFAHFFEHMMFRGTAAHPPDVYQSLLTRAGARQNAYTTDDYTNYHLTFAREDLETMLMIEADRFQFLSYAEDDFRTEARAVLGEYNKDSADPLTKLFETQRAHAFTTHPYRHTTMGFLEDIEDMPNQIDYSRVFFDRWYRPEYTAVIVAGDVTPEETIPTVERYWGQWKRGRYTVEIPAEPPPQGPVLAHMPWSAPTLPWVTVAFHARAFSATTPASAALEVLSALSFGETSELYRRLVDREQTVDQLIVDVPFSADPSLLTIGARLKRGADAPAVRDAILEAAARARRERVDDARLADAKSHARYRLARAMDNTESIAATLARFVRFARSFRTMNEYYRTLAALTPNDLQRVAEETFTDARLVLTTLSHEPLPEAMTRSPSPDALAARGAVP